MNVSTCTAGQLAELMGDLATDAHAERMRAYLLFYGIEDTDQVTDAEWPRLIAAAMRD